MADRNSGPLQQLSVKKSVSAIQQEKIILAAINAKWIHPSLALRLLKANLGPLEAQCEIMEFYLRQSLDEKLNDILDARPFILGISVSIWNHKATLDLLKALKNSAGPTVPIIVLGGPQVSFLPENTEIFLYADYVIRGEGETAFRKLCGELLSGAKNRAERNVGKDGRPVFIDQCINPCIDKNGQYGQTGTELDINKINTGYRLYTDEDLRHKLTYVESSRGCPFACEFCMSSFYGSQVKEFPLETFLAEMDALISRGARNFKFLDRSFNVNIKRSIAIMEFFLERTGRSSTPLCVHFEMIPGNFTHELKELIRRFPPESLRLEIGIQTLNMHTAALIRRLGNTDEAMEILSFLVRETNAIIHADLIAGLPGEDMDSFGKGFDRLWHCLNNQNTANSKTKAAIEIQPGILKLLPGAPIARHSEEYRMHYDSEPPYEVMESACLPFAEMNRIKNFTRFWELIVNRKNYAVFTEYFFSGGKPVFNRFMALSDELLKQFGRNWGIDRKELEAALNSLKDKYKSSGYN
jgi:radical SAM superfamily enzyme YgiQ (UPF0313 family)